MNVLRNAMNSQQSQPDVSQPRDFNLERELGVRKRAEQMLHQVVEAAPDAIVIAGEHGHITLVNRAAERMFGRLRGAMIGRTLGEWFCPESRGRYTHWMARCRTLPTEPIELDIILDSGDVLPVEANVNALTTPEGRSICTMLRDVSQRKAHQRQIERMNAELSEKNASMKEFVYAASHDLQEPLRKIEAFGALLVEEFDDELQAQARDYLGRMTAATGRMRRFINDLLAYSRVATCAPQPRRVDLNETLAWVLSDLDARLQETGGEVRADPLPTIEANAAQMQQLLLNLISNALKFHRPGVAPQVHIGCTRSQPQQHRITISDNGIGIDPKHAERIFGAFQRLHGMQEYEGSGIGLAICRRIVERHDGEIGVTPGLDGGAVFTITLPADCGEETRHEAA